MLDCLLTGEIPSGRELRRRLSSESEGRGRGRGRPGRGSLAPPAGCSGRRALSVRRAGPWARVVGDARVLEVGNTVQNGHRRPES